MDITNWTFEPTVIVAILAAAVTYWYGTRVPLRLVGRSHKSLAFYLRALSFYTGLAVAFVALESPIDSYADTLFAAHMVQHLLLIMVVAPLILLGDPAIPFLRLVPLPARRRGLRYAIGQRWFHTLGRALSWLGSPIPVLAIFLVDLYLWHWNRLFLLTLENQSIHDLEHICFLGTALLFWSQVIDQRPLHCRLSYIQRAGYIVVAAVLSNPLAMYFVFAERPAYSAYAAVAQRPFHLTALTDQQLAGGIMWVPVLFLYAAAFGACLFKWLGEEQKSEAPYTVPGYSVLFPADDGAR